VKAGDFLTLARELASGTEEAGYRSSISRGYYAIYHGCIALSRQCTTPYVQEKDKGMHDRTFERLEKGCIGQAEERLIQAIAKMGRVLKDRRVVADYKLDEPQQKKDAIQTLNSVDRMVEKLMGLNIDISS